MKVLLVHPPLPQRRWGIRLTPLGLSYLAAVARRGGHTTLLLDAPLWRLSLKRLAQLAADFQPDLIGLSSSSPLLDHYRQTALALRPHCRFLAMGGPHVSALEPFDLPGRFPWADYFILGEGEQTFAELLAALQNQVSPEGIPGLVGRWPSNYSPRPLLDDLDLLPWPWRDPASLARSSHPLLPGRSASLIASRGCPHLCLFCDKIIHGHRYRCRALTSVVEEVRFLAQIQGLRSLVFYDDNFSEDAERTAELCQRLQAERLDLNWKCECRVDRVTPPLLQSMKLAGCRVISFGVESGNAPSLRWLKKEVTLEQCRQALAWAKEAGLKTLGYFILALPGETAAEARQTIDFACRLDPDYAQFSFLNCYPGSRWGGDRPPGGASPLFPLRQLNGWLNAGGENWVAAPPTMDQRQQQRLLTYAYRRFYAHPRRLLGWLCNAGFNSKIWRG